MSGEHFLIFVAMPFTAAVLGLLCRGIARSKGRSGWWALAGLGFHIGLIVVLALPIIRPTVPSKTRAPVAPGTGGATRAEGQKVERPNVSSKPVREWRSNLMRKPRTGWRSNDLLWLLELLVTCIMCGWLLFGSIGAVVIVLQTILGIGSVVVNGVRTDSVLAKLGVAALFGVFGVCGAACLFYIRPGLIRGSERGRRRRDRRKRDFTPPPEQ